MCAGHSPATSATAVLPFSAVHSSPTSLALRGPNSRAPRPTALYRPDPRHVCAAAFTADTAAQADPVVRRVLSLGGPSPELFLVEDLRIPLKAVAHLGVMNLISLIWTELLGTGQQKEHSYLFARRKVMRVI